jgi:hypothetical protein
MSHRIFWITCSALLSACLFATSGCSKDKEKHDGSAKNKDQDRKHDHPDEGPHKGALVEWGDEEYHVEYTSDRSKGEATAYILGPDAKTAAPIKADKIQLTSKDPAFQSDLKAAPQKEDPAGKSSVFKGKLPESAKGKKLTGTISGEVEGKPYVGDLKEK